MLILYTTEDGKSQIKLRSEQQTVWLTQLEMAELFDATKHNISPHLKNLVPDGELLENSVVKESLTTENPATAPATVKQSLTVGVGPSHLATTKEFSVVRRIRSVAGAAP